MALSEQLQPDLVVLDVMMPEMTGLEALPQIVAVSPSSKVVVFSSLATVTLSEVARLGGHALLPKLADVHLADAVAAALDQ